MKDDKERTISFLELTFGNNSFPYQNAFEKSTKKLNFVLAKVILKNLYCRL